MINTHDLFSDYDENDGFPDSIMDNHTPVTCSGCGSLVHPALTYEHVNLHEVLHELYLDGRG